MTLSRTPSRTRRTAALVAALALATTTALTAGLVSGAATANPGGEPTVEPVDEALPVEPVEPVDEAVTTLKNALDEPATEAAADAATDALTTVRELFEPLSPAEARAALTDGGVEVTMALRDLAARVDALPTRQREVAADYLARPTSDAGDRVLGASIRYGVGEARPACTPDLCVHYVRSTKDAPPSADTRGAAGGPGANGVPDYVDTVLRVLTDVHDRYLRAGYREPRPDRNRGGDERIDVYLADVGAVGVYGYCTSDQPNTRSGSGPQVYDRWAYCVLDNDYVGFPGTQLENIQVTAAHEYFHATQYAYDAFEDQWFLEATATWAEDELYDDVNDNLQYLPRSPLTAPFVPLDSFISGGLYNGFHYGTWTFFRFLTEKFTARKGGMPRLVLDLMKRVDGSRGARDEYSWQAIQAVLKKKGTTAAKEFLAYSVANRRPQLTYDEGRAQRYPAAPLRGTATLTPRRTRTAPATVVTDHLTSATYRITPRKLRSKRTRLRVVLDMAPRTRGSMAAVTVVPAKGRVKTYDVRLDRRGDGSRVVPFSSRRVRHVEVTLANTSGATTCFQDAGSPFSCLGVPTHDRQQQRMVARLVR